MDLIDLREIKLNTKSSREPQKVWTVSFQKEFAFPSELEAFITALF